ncbi:MAG: TatD family hydrolase [Gammaproteobacteria bacterium]|nr:TatD family hydrolase [Gammaproteobacteria bacterium]MBU1656262.1 TatD family hydrolase [Gammaproteobacteria bacterium]MBU1959827.1 TatD family hydrolase [Gammaproteobacteria bacterium]
MNSNPLPPIFDTHCHLDVEEFDADRFEVLAGARRCGVQGMLVPAVDAAGWRGLLDLCSAEDDLFPALGLHPIYLDRHADGDLDRLVELVERERPAAIGEIGLDFFIPEPDRERQQQLFERQLIIAREARLPVILHVRKAHDQVLATLRRMGIRNGIAHAFNGSLEQARQYREQGFLLGFGGMLTYAHSRKLRALAQSLPLDALVLETDAPDMSPRQHRGERNSPEYLPFCLAALVEVRDEEPRCIAAATTRNACRLLRLVEGPPDQQGS